MPRTSWPVERHNKPLDNARLARMASVDGGWITYIPRRDPFRAKRMRILRAFDFWVALLVAVVIGYCVLGLLIPLPF